MIAVHNGPANTTAQMSIATNPGRDATTRRRSLAQAVPCHERRSARACGRAVPSSPWSQCFSRSYASVLPTSLGHIAPLTRRYSRRNPDAVIGTAEPVREATDALFPAHEARGMYASVEELWISGRAFVRIVKAPRTAQIGRAAFSMCSDAFLHLK